MHWPSAIIRVTPLYWMCGRVVYLRVAFLHHIHATNVCEKFVNCERIFCMDPDLAVFTSSTVTWVPNAPGSVHICQDSLWTWHLLHLAVFTSGTRCSWRYSHLLLWLWHLLHLAVFTLVSMTGTRCPCPSPPFTGCATVCVRSSSFWCC